MKFEDVIKFLDFWKNQDIFDDWIVSLSEEQKQILYSHPAIQDMKEMEGDILP